MAIFFYRSESRLASWDWNLKRVCVIPRLTKRRKKASQEQNPVPQAIRPCCSPRDRLFCATRNSLGLTTQALISWLEKYIKPMLIFLHFQILSAFNWLHSDLLPGERFSEKGKTEFVFLLEMAISYRQSRCLKTQAYAWLKSVARMKREREERCKKT